MGDMPREKYLTRKKGGAKMEKRGRKRLFGESSEKRVYTKSVSLPEWMWTRIESEEGRSDYIRGLILEDFKNKEEIFMAKISLLTTNGGWDFPIPTQVWYPITEENNIVAFAFGNLADVPADCRNKTFVSNQLTTAEQWDFFMQEVEKWVKEYPVEISCGKHKEFPHIEEQKHWLERTYTD